MIPETVFYILISAAFLAYLAFGAWFVETPTVERLADWLYSFCVPPPIENGNFRDRQKFAEKITK